MTKKDTKKKDKKQLNEDWAAKRARQLGVSRNLIIGIIASR